MFHNIWPPPIDYPAAAKNKNTVFIYIADMYLCTSFISAEVPESCPQYRAPLSWKTAEGILHLVQDVREGHAGQEPPQDWTWETLR